MRSRPRTTVIAGIVVVAVLAGCGIAFSVERKREKDRRDLISLTGLAPWPRHRLLLPDAMPAAEASGSVGSDGLRVGYPLHGTGLRVAYAIEVLDERGEALWSVSCKARAVAICADLGDAYTYVKVLDTDNSDPATIVRRLDGGRLLSASLTGDHPEYLDRLRGAVTDLHTATDAELLSILRPDGYQTDWS